LLLLLLRLLKIRAIGWRAFRPLYRKGLELLKRGHFDLIYISTAQFNLFCLGRLWWRRTGVPYVLDFHDPWVRRDRYRTTRSSWKRGIDRVLSRFLESFAVHKAAGIVSVSPNYLERLQSRYPNATALQNGRTMVVPFAAVELEQRGDHHLDRVVVQLARDPRTLLALGVDDLLEQRLAPPLDVAQRLGVLALVGLSGVVAGDMQLRNIGIVGYVGVLVLSASSAVSAERLRLRTVPDLQRMWTGASLANPRTSRAIVLLLISRIQQRWLRRPILRPLRTDAGARQRRRLHAHRQDERSSGDGVPGAEAERVHDALPRAACRKVTPWSSPDGPFS